MNGPSLWQPLVDVTKAVYGSAVVAGGSCRDYAVHKNIKPRDVDLFVRVEDEMELEVGYPALRPTIDARLLEGGSYHIEDNSSIVAVLGGRAENGVKINVVGVPFDPSDFDRLFETFDHSLCQFAFDGSSVVSSDAAKKTLDTGVIEVYDKSVKTKQRLGSLIDRNKSYGRFTFEAFDLPKPVSPDKLRFEDIFAELLQPRFIARNIRIPVEPVLGDVAPAPAWEIIR